MSGLCVHSITLVGVDLLACFCGGHNPRSRRAFEKAGLAVLRTVPRPGSPKADLGYDLILTREQYERTREPPGPCRGHHHAVPPAWLTIAGARPPPAICSRAVGPTPLAPRQ